MSPLSCQIVFQILAARTTWLKINDNIFKKEKKGSLLSPLALLFFLSCLFFWLPILDFIFASFLFFQEMYLEESCVSQRWFLWYYYICYLVYHQRAMVVSTCLNCNFIFPALANWELGNFIVFCFLKCKGDM